MSERLRRARNPRTGALDYSFVCPDAPVVERAVIRARAAQPAWSEGGVPARAAALNGLADQIEQHRPGLQLALECDTGRRRLAGAEIDAVIAALRGWPLRAAELLRSGWSAGRSMPHLRYTSEWRPYPVVGVVSPWNFPLLLSMIDAIPALCAGCAVIVKPSEVTPRFIEPLAACAQVIPQLADVLQLLPGDVTTGEALVDAADCICFTGSVATGRKVASRAAARLVPAYLELGGKDPLLVLAGADLAIAVRAALRGAVLASGQACQSIERIYVAREIHDEFVERLCEAARAVRLNWPDIAHGELGPIIFEGQARTLAEQIEDARGRGARVLTGGVIETHGGGLWMRPTVLTQVTHEMLIMREETFGPVLPVMPFDSIEEAVQLANWGRFGLSAAIIAPTLDQAACLARRLEAGAVSLNDAALTALFYEAPKQSFKASGLGPSRMGPDALLRFCRRQALIANEAEPAALAAFAEDARPPGSG